LRETAEEGERQEGKGTRGEMKEVKNPGTKRRLERRLGEFREREEEVSTDVMRVGRRVS
jgi:hypothetical protein